MSAIPTTTQTITFKGESVVVNESPGTKCWRLVHDGKKVISLFETMGITRTRNTLFCAETEAEVQAEISRLKLIPLPEKEKEAKK